MSERELFWEWAKKENPKLIDEAETGCQFAKDILDYMFMGWVGSANRQGYKLVPIEPSKDMLNSGYRVKHDKIIDLGNVYKAMIGEETK